LKKVDKKLLHEGESITSSVGRTRNDALDEPVNNTAYCLDKASTPYEGCYRLAKNLQMYIFGQTVKTQVQNK
jgi:hypothetical protein